ncbi:MAG TPA: MauE/DoxX family redox-associated membrane protein [Actinomycetes bacterium]|nr:MauE/DoxX family redox-associated membrane protein [Actinomycetes bacterium]
MSRFRGSSAQLWISTAVRLGLAGVLFWSGGAKVTEPQQAVLAVQAYEILPVKVGEFVGYALPLMELALAVALLLGVATRVTAIVAGALMTAFVVGVASAWARGLSIDCGCFGGGGAVPEGEANYLPVLLRDLGFTLMAGWLVVFPGSRLAIDRSGRAGTGDLGLYDEWDDAAEAEAEGSSQPTSPVTGRHSRDRQQRQQPEQEQR